MKTFYIMSSESLIQLQQQVVSLSFFVRAPSCSELLLVSSLLEFKQKPREPNCTEAC